MGPEDRVESLLAAYVERRLAGQAPADPEELCGDCPELIDRLKAGIARYEAVVEGLADSDRDPAPVTAARRLAPSCESPGPRGPRELATGTRPEEVVAVGGRVGNIRLLRCLGAGGMGEVFEGFDETLQRKVALKAISGHLLLSANTRARFLREARILSRLEHPGICQIYDYLEDEAGDFLVLELIEGDDLAVAIHKGIHSQVKLKIARDIAAVLAAAHAERVIHRDLKPSNVMLTPKGEIKVLDFGLARPAEGAAAGGGVGPLQAGRCPEAAVLKEHNQESETLPLQPAEPSGRHLASVRTKTGQVVGTPAFMSPEQARGEPPTTACDMYSFGLLLQHLFTERLPYDRSPTLAEMLEKVGKGESLPLIGVGSDLASLIGQLKTVAPASRPTAVETLRRLEWILDKPRRRLRRLAFALAVTVSLLAGLKYTVDLQRERKVAVRAQQVAEERRGQAENLIDFMLLDLRDSLEPMGRLDILEKVARESQAYFAATRSDDPSPDSLRRRAISQWNVGAVLLGKGDSDEALSSYRQALLIFEDLARQDPEDLERQTDFGVAHLHLGRAQQARGDSVSASESLHSARSVFEELIARSPSPKLRMRAAEVLTELGEVHHEQADWGPALQWYRRANELHERLVAEDPRNQEWQVALARGRARVGRALREEGDAPAALEMMGSALDVYRRLAVREPANMDWPFEIAELEKGIGAVHFYRGPQSKAIAHYEQARRIFRRLTQHDPLSTEWLARYAGIHEWIGWALEKQGQQAEALEFHREARRLRLQLGELDPDNYRWRHWVAHSDEQIGSIQRAQGRFQEALASYQAANSTYREQFDADVSDAAVANRLAWSHVQIGLLRQRLGETEPAREEWKRAVTVIEPVTRSSRNDSWLDTHVKALLLLGEIKKARPIVDHLVAKGWNDATFDRLVTENGLRRD